MKLTNSEQEIMEVFWSEGKPLSQMELLACCGEKSWKDRSVYILLNGLLKKGILKEDGFVRSGKSFARRFSPTLSYEQYCCKLITSNKRQPDLPKLFCALLDENELSDEMLNELSRCLEQKRNK